MRWQALVVVVVLMLGAGVIGWVGAKRSTDAIDRETVHELLRAAGDSAVTAFVDSDSMEAFVAAALADTVDHYQAEVRAAARVVVRRDTVRTTDTVRVVEVVQTADTADFALPPIDTAGVLVTDTLRLAPVPELWRPSFLERRAAIGFQPDTLLVALLRTEDGIDRFTAAMEGEGYRVRIGDAAQVRERGRSGWGQAADLATGLVCVGAGFLAAERKTGPAVAAGALCAGGMGLSVAGFW